MQTATRIRTLPTVGCRKCGGAVTHDAAQCLHCECRTPFACAACGKALGAVSLGIPPNRKHPFGALSQAGEVLCHQHRLTACHHCGDLHPLQGMTRQHLGERLDRETRAGKPPRVEPVFGYACAACLQRKTPDRGHTQRWLVGGIILATSLLVAGLVLLSQ